MFTVTGPKRIDLKVPAKCPACGRTIEIKLRSAGPGTVLPCSCGASIRLTGDDMRKAQAAMDQLVDTIHRLGRR